LRILVTILLFLGLQSSAQELEGYYAIVKRESGVGSKDVFHFRNDSSFRYQGHSMGLILVGEGMFRKQGDTLVLYFRNCQTCRVDTSTVLSRSTAPTSWIYLKKLMPWGIDIWGIQDEVMAFTIRPGKKDQVIFTDKSSVTRYRRLSGKDMSRYKDSFSKYFID
jgi:hypothetical protein